MFTLALVLRSDYQLLISTKTLAVSGESLRFKTRCSHCHVSVDYSPDKASLLWVGKWKPGRAAKKKRLAELLPGRCWFTRSAVRLALLPRARKTRKEGASKEEMPMARRTFCDHIHKEQL